MRLLFYTLIFCINCNQIVLASVLPEIKVESVKLEEPGWNPFVKQKLIEIIEKKKGQKLPVVFDFDNTLVCRDIGEATFAVMIRDGLLRPETIPPGITPVDLSKGNLMEVYEAYLEAGSHHVLDKAPYLNAYAWLVQMMAGLTPAKIIEKTSTAYNQGAAEADRKNPTSLTSIVIEPKKTQTLTPYFYPEMVELVGELLKADYEVWVISASNVWTVRWMITEVLNQKLKEKGITKGIKPQQVIGISTLLYGPNGRLYKDPFLTIENAKYAALEKKTLNEYKLSTQIVPPMSAYFGKSANILQWIGKTPYLVAGDSPNDHGMLTMAEHKLWITRLEKPAYQKETVALALLNRPNSWLFQPTLTTHSSGFVADAHDLAKRINISKENVALSIQIFKGQPFVKNFDLN